MIFKLNQAVFAAGLACAASQNLRSGERALATEATNMIANGSFEETTVAKGRWSHFDAKHIPGWKSLHGERIEIWGTGMLGVPSLDGHHHLEIDYHLGGTDAIYQDIATVSGQSYDLSMYIRARRANFDSEDETAILEWNGAEVLVATAEKAGVWTKVSVTVQGTGGMDRLVIRESTAGGANNSLGPLIDLVQMVPIDGDACVVTQCYLRDLDTNNEAEITASYSYSPNGRYSIRCNTAGKVDHSKWRFNNGETSDDWKAPFWMKNNADDGSDGIWESDYLGTCGNKSVTFEANVWGSDVPCASKALEFEATC